MSSAEPLTEFWFSEFSPTPRSAACAIPLHNPISLSNSRHGHFDHAATVARIERRRNPGARGVGVPHFAALHAGYGLDTVVTAWTEPGARDLGA
jgi:hypothetical protein